MSTEAKDKGKKKTCTIRTRHFMTNRLLQRKQFVSFYFQKKKMKTLTSSNFFYLILKRSLMFYTKEDLLFPKKKLKKN